MRTRTAAALAAVAALTLAGCGAAGGHEPPKAEATPGYNDTDDSTLNDTPADWDEEDLEYTPEPEPVISEPKAKDFKVTLKVKSKACFGSAGCNYTVEPDVAYNGALPLDDTRTFDLTYKITGPETAPVIDTATIDGDQVSYTPSIFSTAPGVTPKASVVSVEEGGSW
ncbi:hypothetical protein H181DRAFT_01209 [Streptomyces sp. WMMB 714]|uniref:hypothetical protein n=1 Tax=Streptomyces sp. WMMB 714 TaxID=1286822 RepID=UPI0006963341|nr:hypothetical protein [Streptomyces sp. WMMB 714]SCK17778.1 hypothetical protein H181DRAFT_01209 [Streptomyces sp. WMMB 714]